MIRYKWKCPICKKTGNKWLSRHKARRNGSVHIKKIHNKIKEPIILKKLT